jgi:hypothetical protein
MLTDARQRLAAAQAELVRALVSAGPIPAGFDASRIRATARSLVNKRRQALARAWPALVHGVGDGFLERFNAFAADHPLPVSANSLADGRAFLAWLDSQEALNDVLRVEAMSYDVRFVETVQGVRRRRGFVLKTAKLRESGTRVLAVRLPWLGERWWRFPRRS